MAGWENDMRCALNPAGPCRANILQACLCRKMPEHEYRDLLNETTGRNSITDETND